METNSIKKATEFIQKLLSGQIPLEGIKIPNEADFGEYVVQCSSLLTIFKTKGLEDCRRAYLKLLETNPELSLTPYPLDEGMKMLSADEIEKIHEKPITALSVAELCASLYSDTLKLTDGGRWLFYQDQKWVVDDKAPYRCMMKAIRTLQVLVAQRKPKVDEKGLEIESDVKKRQKDLMRAIALENHSQDMLVKNLRVVVYSVSERGLDAHPNLIGCPNGIINLSTGELVSPSPQLLITKQTRIPYNPHAPKPKRWLQFLDEVFNGDEDLIEFVRLAIGYTLTGHTKEQIFFLLYGTGANGKTTFINVLGHILGEYAQNTPFNTFEHGKETSTGNDLARLNGSRAVFTSEVNEGSRFNTQRVKALTGEDEITARFLYREYFTFKPQFKVFMAVNHKPTVRDDSEGFWRRVRLIPFTQSFTGDKADENLMEKLLSESEAILAWCVRASVDYLKTGLPTPQAVMVATQAYRDENDILGLFLDEKCTLGINARCKSSSLYEAYRGFAEENGLHPLSNVKFSQSLEKKGFTKSREAGAGYVVWNGIGLLAEGDE